MGLQGLNEMIALILSNHKKAILSPLLPSPSSKQTVILRITGRQKQLRDRRFITSNRLPLLSITNLLILQLVIPHPFLKDIFNWDGPLVTTSPSTRQELHCFPPSSLPLTDNILSYISLKGAEPNFHYPKCQDSFLSPANTAASLQQPFGESKWNKAPTNNCIFPGPGLTLRPCHIRYHLPPLLFLGVKILISRVSL